MLDEHLYSFSVNGRILTSLFMMKGREKEFAYGYLATEGIVTPDRIESVMADDTDISVLTTDTQQVLLPKKIVVSGCGGTASYLDATKLPKLTGTHTAPTLKGFTFTSPVLKEGGFSAAIYTLGKTYTADDIGQTQAADKAIGAALIAKSDPVSAALLVASKVSADLVRKCLIAGIPVIISKCPATTLATQIARDGNLLLVCDPTL